MFDKIFYKEKSFKFYFSISDKSYEVLKNEWTLDSNDN